MIGPQGARYILDTLKKNSTLLYLNIASFVLFPAHIFLACSSTILCFVFHFFLLLEFLFVFSAMVVVVGIDNQVGADSACHFFDMLRKNSTISYLNISGPFLLFSFIPYSLFFLISRKYSLVMFVYFFSVHR